MTNTFSGGIVTTKWLYGSLTFTTFLHTMFPPFAKDKCLALVSLIRYL